MVNLQLSQRWWAARSPLEASFRADWETRRNSETRKSNRAGAEGTGPGRPLTHRAMRWNQSIRMGTRGEGGLLVAHQVAAFAGWARARDRGLFREGGPRVGGGSRRRVDVEMCLPNKMGLRDPLCTFDHQVKKAGSCLYLRFVPPALEVRPET